MRAPETVNIADLESTAGELFRDFDDISYAAHEDLWRTFSQIGEPPGKVFAGYQQVHEHVRDGVVNPGGRVFQFHDHVEKRWENMFTPDVFGSTKRYAGILSFIEAGFELHHNLHGSKNPQRITRIVAEDPIPGAGVLRTHRLEAVYLTPTYDYIGHVALL